MELKFQKAYENYYSIICSNRTFMELKYKICRMSKHNFISSNRTFMELKSRGTHTKMRQNLF